MTRSARLGRTMQVVAIAAVIISATGCARDTTPDAMVFIAEFVRAALAAWWL